MRYWEEMQSKWGFSDGDAIPDGVEKYREIYVRAMNKLLEQEGSSVRLVTYDRPGVHNSYLILTVPLDKFDATHAVDGDHSVVDEADTDDAFDRAYGNAQELMLDDYVEVVVTISDEFKNLVKRDFKPE